MEVASSPLFLQVQQRIHRTQRPRHLTQDEQAEVQFAWEKLAAGQPEVQARHVKMALRAMGFQVKKADVAELLQQHGLAPDGALGWQAFSEVRLSRCRLAVFVVECGAVPCRTGCHHHHPLSNGCVHRASMGCGHVLRDRR
jgi:hypothetical protein